MEKFYFEEPTLARKNEALEYLQEHVECGSAINGTGSMDKCLKGWTYEQWLEELERRKDLAYLKQVKRSPSKTFFLIRANDNKIVGMINLRYQIDEATLKNGGSHIGYGIRPSERRKGYNKINLFLGLLELQKLGEEKLLVDCTVDNVGSNKTLVALGGKLERTEIDSYDNSLTNYYTINTTESINKCKDIYEPYIQKTKKTSRRS